jgi:SAM-dependent methyltransferase
MSDAANQWTKFYTETSGMMYPAEAVIRIFKGSYPNLKMPKPKEGDSILDVGCGDGRHFPLFKSLGMKTAGTEITDEIVDDLSTRIRPSLWKRFLTWLWRRKLPPPVDIRVGTCASLPWPDATFDYLLTWNSCYYMGPDGKLEDHVAEMARVIKPSGWIVCSVPKHNCFIFKDAEFGDDGYVTIVNDHFGLRNGERMRSFWNASALQEAFEPSFHNFSYASIDIDMFGLAYHWHVIVAQRT